MDGTHTGTPTSPTDNWVPTPVDHSDSAQLQGAREAYRRGERFFQCEIEVGETSGNSRWGSSSGAVASRSRVDLLGGIEQIGWKLEDVGYAYAETGSVSTDRLLRTGQGTVNKGVIVGIYLFRRRDGD